MEFHFQRSYRGPLKAAILDWAGTTVDFGCMAPAVVFIEVFNRRGVEITMGQAREPMGMNKRDHIQRIARMEPVARLWAAKHGCACSEADIDAMYKEFIPLQIETLARHSALIPGTLGMAADLRRRGMKLGSCTGYNAEMLQVVVREARARGFEPDAAFSASDVPRGRPEPWMCLLNAMKLGVYPPEACVKVGDTVPDVGEGLNAGMWTIGVVMCGNEIGLTEDDLAALPAEERERRRRAAHERLAMAGAHLVVDSIGDVPAAIEDINGRLARGERP